MCYRVGDVRIGGISEFESLDSMLSEASLLYDATAELGVQRFLSELAYERKLPYIAVSGTQGGWGGMLLRIRPGKTAGCFLCYRLQTELPEPPSKPFDGIQPAGCADPTFTGAGFDMSAIAMQGVRLAISTLCAGHATGYPEADWDIAIISLRSADGSSLLTNVETFQLPRHPECPVCAQRAAGQTTAAA